MVDGLKTSGHDSSGSTASHVAHSAQSNAAKYADRYLGVSAAERRFYQKLGVDPYTDNEVLRKAVKRAAKVDAATTLGLHFVAVPGLPWACSIAPHAGRSFSEIVDAGGSAC